MLFPPAPPPQPSCHGLTTSGLPAGKPASYSASPQTPRPLPSAFLSVARMGPKGRESRRCPRTPACGWDPKPPASSIGLPANVGKPPSQRRDPCSSHRWSLAHVHVHTCITPLGPAPLLLCRSDPQPFRQYLGLEAAWGRWRAGGLDAGRRALPPLAPLARAASCKDAEAHYHSETPLPSAAQL